MGVHYARFHCNSMRDEEGVLFRHMTLQARSSLVSHRAHANMAGMTDASKRYF